MSIYFRQHQFEPRRSRKRDVYVIRCEICERRVELSLRTRQPVFEMLTALKVPECPGPVDKVPE